MNKIKMLYFGAIDVSEETEVNKTDPYVCNRCHDLLMMSMNLSNITILMQNVDLTETRGIL